MAAMMRASVLIVALPPDALELAVLEHPQQLGLQVERQLADLVEEQRAAVRDLEPTFPHPGRAGERALLVPEQLALDQRRRHRRTVHLISGRARRGLRLWMAVATTSLPTPVSPRISTVLDVSATCRALPST